MSCSRPYTSLDKWSAATISGLLFLLISSPYTYSLTNSVLNRIGLRISTDEGCPNMTGMFIHAAAFAVIIRLIIEKKSNGCMKPYTSKDKWIVSVIGAMLFLLISSPFFYDLIDTVISSFGIDTAAKGCPNLRGLIVHSIVFILVVRLLMR